MRVLPETFLFGCHRSNCGMLMFIYSAVSQLMSPTFALQIQKDTHKDLLSTDIMNCYYIC